MAETNKKHHTVYILTLSSSGSPLINPLNNEHDLKMTFQNTPEKNYHDWDMIRLGVWKCHITELLN